MRTQDGYKTKQREVIENVLKETNGRHITAEEITEILAEKGCNVGRTTVYRCLDKMISDGRVQKYSAETGTSACYQYINGDVCKEHFHLKCIKCGRLIHIECEQMNELSNHIDSEHGFKVDKLKTVLYGICEECTEK